ncbi:ABC transporter ATP-binding protein [Demequina activiva]|uniref:ABC transporter ATP-binding protein n=1 Tax=Demequina activiva TaxID=1582364 RepID=A0A919Q0Y4_9MICO|nr:ATP-binding cassette domain-containing protein [Demequina activiva]GIG54004.1 ABC transporter ATP-binding protein [Demequina activiva]
MSDSSQLSVSGLTHSFGDRRVLDDVTFDVRPGRLTGFVGANGAGKTTTMRSIVGVLKPDAGTVTFGGEPLSLAVRRRIGYMPEERGLYPKMKVHEQLVFLGRVLGVDRDVAATRATALLKDFGLGDRADDVLHTLSLGNQQRVQVAAALIHEPRILVLDEPFSGLDPIAMDTMAARLQESAAQGVPVLFSSHQLELVEKLCDDLVLINRGAVVAAGDAAALQEERAGRRYRVQVAAAPEWTPAGAGFEVASRDARGVLVDLDETADTQDLLAQAQRAGAVEHFGRVVPTLAELFQEVAR